MCFSTGHGQWSPAWKRCSLTTAGKSVDKHWKWSISTKRFLWGVISWHVQRSHKVVSSLRSGEWQRCDYICLLPHCSSPGCPPLSFCLFREKAFGRLLYCLNASCKSLVKSQKCSCLEGDDSVPLTPVSPYSFGIIVAMYRLLNAFSHFFLILFPDCHPNLFS